ncbi:MAG: hypothetical protein WC119_02425 [Synergistaceae bacterium]
MKKLFTQQELFDAKFDTLMELECENCGDIFRRKKREIIRRLEVRGNSYSTCDYCSRSCQKKAKSIKCICSNCNEPIQKMPSQFQKSKNHFCSRSCAASYNNKHKTKGTRVSKLEKWLQEQLVQKYPLLKFDFNKTDAIESELDIYIPKLKLAFELNGIFHYEPIFGNKKLTSIQKMDKNKMQACQKNNISLCVLDTTSLKYFKIEKAIMFFEIVAKIIDKHLKIR